MDSFSKKNTFFIVAFLLAFGLVVTIILSFQVMKDTKSAVAPEPAKLPDSQTTGSQASIYDINIPFSSGPLVPATEEAQPKEVATAKKKPKPIQPEQIKTYQQEQAELSAGLQPDYSATASTDPSVSQLPSEPASASPAPEETLDTTKYPQPTKEDIQDIQRKGLIIF
jgi:cytoskeletal protein RodZ